MSQNKLKLPSSLINNSNTKADSSFSDDIKSEIIKTKRCSIESNSKVEIAKLQVAKEAIAVTKSFFEILKSHNELQATRTEWEGRVLESEIAVKKAQINLEISQEENRSKLQELEQIREAQTRLLYLFDEVMTQITRAELSEEVKKESRYFLLQLSDRIVQLKK